ncbi:hypothetical protein [Haloarcula amylolytica]|uniref:hypothetical protein n=1 Tax=Haloarcula amylolytica TaxID=396317 RepID=UPI003C75DBA1
MIEWIDIHGTMRRSAKIRISIILVLLVSPYFIVTYFAPTSSYRNVFFYADIVDAQLIAETGHVSQNVLKSTFTDSFINSWTKLSTRAKTPIVPISLYILSEVSGLSLSVIHSHIPGYVVIFLFYFVIIKHFQTKWIAAIFAAIGTVGPNLGPIGALGISPFKYSIVLMGVFILLLRTRIEEKKFSLVMIIILPLLETYIIYLYPRLALFLPLALSSYILLSKLRGRNTPPYRAFLTTTTVLFLHILVTLPGYQVAAEKVLIGLVNLSFIIPLQGSGAQLPSTAMGSRPYGLIAVPLLFLLGIRGGLQVSIKALFREFENKELVVFSFGASAFIISLLHLFTGVVWLASRVYVIAFPVLVIGAAIGYRGLFQQNWRYGRFLNCAIIVVLLIASFSSFILLAQSTRLDVQTYQDGSVTAADWNSKYQQGTIFGDMKFGSQQIAAGYYDYRYPTKPNREENIIRHLYNGTYPEEVSAVVYYEDMATTGFYVPEFMRRPIGEKRYKNNTMSKSRIYSNGQVTMVSEN